MGSADGFMGRRRGEEVEIGHHGKHGDGRRVCLIRVLVVGY